MMQKDQSASNGRFRGYSSLSSSIFNRSDGYGYTSLNPSIFAANENLESPLLALPYSDDYSRPPQYSFTEHDDGLLEHRKLCLSKILETSKQAEALRQENLNLQIANIELKKKFNDLLRLQSSSIRNCPVSPANYYSHTASSNALCSSPLIDGFRRMRITEKPAAWEDEASSESMDTEDGGENLDVNRVSLPKSISVRSDGYLKAVQTDGVKRRGSCPVRMPNRIKPVKPPQRVCVPGGEKEENAVELQVFNQGVSKTELCNKWQQTGACPYGNRCRFAHGIEELRPVLRHPRYKTEVCRMVLNGEHCPYGHRCHFRHCLTDQEKLVAQEAKMKTVLSLK